MDDMKVASQSSPTPESKVVLDGGKAGKAPVVRGARACTVCRAAKMKCVGADDGQPCQRCKRSGAECVFEKHRRGRKPGSKLSEASKMLRRLEKGLNSAKLKSQSNETPYPSDSRSSDRLANNDLPPLNLPPDYDSPTYASAGSRNRDDDDNDTEKGDEGIFPAKLIQKERNSSFFKIILNPEPYEPTASRSNSERSFTLDTPRPKTPSLPSPNPPRPLSEVSPNSLGDPITLGIIDEAHANVLFDLFFLRLNPFVNLFDPALHTVNYVRSRCPFLFTTILMACCKFFDSDNYKQVQQLAQDYAVRVFAENWKRVEVCQAFACLVYWKEPEDQRTWTYIGYACRMAVELGLNRYVGKRTPEETDIQILERRNRERTYLVLFVHDRSLSTQTGRQWMLPECELVRHSTTWHEDGEPPIRPEDVIVSAFVQLRLIASENTELFQPHRGIAGHHADMNYDVLLRNCNGKLTQWAETWEHEMTKANGEKFHFAFLNFFRLYVRLFLNSFGIQASMSSTTRTSPLSAQALSACFSSALDNLKIVTDEFASISMLRYSQDSITVMTAYSAVFLLRLLRSSNTLAQLHEGATDEIYTHISKTAEAYHEASLLSPSSSSSAAAHARFLRSLVAQDIFRARQHSRSHEPRTHGSYNGSASQPQPAHYHTSSVQSAPEPHQPFAYQGPRQVAVGPPQPMNNHPHLREMDYSPQEPPSRVPPIMTGYAAFPGMQQSQVSQQMPPHTPVQQSMPQPQQYSPQPYPTSESDANYWRIMFRELGFGDSGENGGFPSIASTMPHIGATPSAAANGATHAEYQEQAAGNGHVAYSSHTNGRHYQPYPTPNYGPHHSGYAGHVGR